MNNVLITETDNIGDVILSLPVFKSIKLYDKRIKITALVNTYTEDIVKNFSYIDDVISFSSLTSKNDIDNLRLKIKSQNFDTAIMLHPNRPIAKILKNINIKNRFSYGWKWYQYLFTKVLIQHRSKNVKHQMEYNLDILKLTPVNITNKIIKLKPVGKETAFIDTLLKSKKIKNKYLIGIHPGSGNSAINLPADKYIELIELINKKFKKAVIMITGSQNDTHIIDNILTRVKAKIYPMPLNLSLSVLTALISKMNMFISNSTGPMHIASALRIPVVSFFSPVFIHSPIRWGPVWGKKLIIKPEIKCLQKWECQKEKCPLYNCFNKIDFIKVIEFISQNM